MHKSAIAQAGCIATVSGIVIAQSFGWPLGTSLSLVCAGTALLVAVAIPRVSVGAVICLGVLLGGARADSITNPQEEIVPGWATFQAIVVREPEIRVDRQVFVAQQTQTGLRIRVTRPLQPRLQIGESLELTCELQRPEPFNDFAYDKYLQRHGIAASCSFPGMKRLGRDPSWRTALFDAKESLASGVRRSLPSPEHTIVLGALFGDKRAVPEHIMEDFRTTGTSHVLAISGLHMTLIAGMLLQLTHRLPIRRPTAYLLVVTALLVYVLLTGFQTSAIRATLFASATYLFEATGRPSNSLRVLVIAATGMLLVNPLLLLHDVGFQLSFAASGGIILFSGWFEERLRWMPEVLGLRSGLAASLSAILTTSPIIMYGFQVFSVSAFVANMVLVPLMPFVMNGSILLTVVAAVAPSVAALVAAPLYLLLHLLIEVAHLFAQLPYASISLPRIPAWAVLSALGAILLMARQIHQPRYEA